MTPFPPELAARARRLRLLLFDVDGVLTDGTILLDAEGRESKRFSIRDGTALVVVEAEGRGWLADLGATGRDGLGLLRQHRGDR